jgi:predicted Rossmann fold nucleotide-binding protein DprA/Smf involved in DNA uptake
MTELEKVVKTVAEGLKALAQGIEKLAEKVEDISDKKPQPKAKAKPKKTVKKPAAKKEKEATASDTVLKVINRHKKGVNTATIMEKTGFEKKKVANAVFRLKKEGKIKSAGRGIYIKA